MEKLLAAAKRMRDLLIIEGDPSTIAVPREIDDMEFMAAFDALADAIDEADTAIRKLKWPGRVTSSTTEGAHAICPDDGKCRKGCIDQRSITWADAPEIH